MRHPAAIGLKKSLNEISLYGKWLCADSLQAGRFIADKAVSLHTGWVGVQ
jgi:hypothetical protein